ncbi:MAG: type II secretion system protein [Candidatus Hydrogenedentes bacterium]|nr:type II secretion system protein [Candidatus Hydrogenedentota bacterium]
MRQCHPNRGFTLLELLVVISLMAIATGMGAVILVRVLDVWSNLKIGAELDSTAQSVFSSIEQDLSQAVNTQLAGFAIKGETGVGKDDKQLFGVALAQDRFTVPVQLPMLGGGKAAALVGYHIEQTLDGEWQLMRTLRSIRGEGETSSTLVARGVLQMRVEYANAAGEWLPAWSEPWHPKAVRVSVTVCSPDNIHRMQTARKAVLEVHAP